MAANVLGLKSNAHMSYTGCNLNGHAGASGPCAKGTPRQLVVLLSLFMFFTFLKNLFVDVCLPWPFLIFYLHMQSWLLVLTLEASRATEPLVLKVLNILMCYPQLGGNLSCMEGLPHLVCFSEPLARTSRKREPLHPSFGEAVIRLYKVRAAA